MKKLLLTAAAVMVATINTFAQGAVSWGNGTTSLVINSLTGAAAASAAGIRAALYWAPLNDPTNFRVIGSTASVGTPLAGRYSGGNATTGAETAGGDMAWFQVRAWENSYGSTYEAATSAPASGGRLALRGVSNTFMGATAPTTGSPPPTPIALNSLIQGFTVVVPEPSAIALGLLGAGALLLLRRRK